MLQPTAAEERPRRSFGVRAEPKHGRSRDRRSRAEGAVHPRFLAEVHLQPCQREQRAGDYGRDRPAQHSTVQPKRLASQTVNADAQRERHHRRRQQQRDLPAVWRVWYAKAVHASRVSLASQLGRPTRLTLSARENDSVTQMR